MLAPCALIDDHTTFSKSRGKKEIPPNPRKAITHTTQQVLNCDKSNLGGWIDWRGNQSRPHCWHLPSLFSLAVFCSLLISPCPAFGSCFGPWSGSWFGHGLKKQRLFIWKSWKQITCFSGFEGESCFLFFPGSFFSMSQEDFISFSAKATTDSI